MKLAMKFKLRLLLGLLSLAALGAVVYVRASSKNSAPANPVPAVAISPGDSCCGPDPASALPMVNYATPAGSGQTGK